MKTLKRGFLLTILLVFFMFQPVVLADTFEAGTNAFFEEKTESNLAYIQKNATISEEEAHNRILSLQSQYPEGMPWTNDMQYVSKGRQDGYITLAGAGCHGFALICSDAAFGDADFYQHNDLNKVNVGDILRINNNTHSVVVLEVRPDSFVITEGNYNSSIHWGRVLPRDGLEVTYILTRYGDPSKQLDQPASNPDQDNVYRICNTITGEHLYTADWNEVVTLVYNGNWNYEGIGWVGPKSGTPVYRLFNSALGDHLFTTNEYEKSQLLTRGWQNDNDGNPLFYAGGSTPIYRLYNPITKRHLLTKDLNEYNVLSTSNGWNGEDIAFTSIN